MIISISGEKFYTAQEAADLLGYNVTYFRSKLNKNPALFEGSAKRRGSWLIPALIVERELQLDPMYRSMPYSEVKKVIDESEL